MINYQSLILNSVKVSQKIDLWVEQAKQGDSEAFGKVYDELVTPIYRYIYYRVDQHVAEDLTEDTFFKAWKNIKKYKKGKHNFSAWLFRIAHNLVVDHYRKNKYKTDPIDENFVDTKDTPVQKVNIKLNQIRIRKMIKKLPQGHQQVIVLKYINELSNKEIAQSLGKSEGAIRTIQFRALEKLRSWMKEEK